MTTLQACPSNVSRANPPDCGRQRVNVWIMMLVVAVRSASWPRLRTGYVSSLEAFDVARCMQPKTTPHVAFVELSMRRVGAETDRRIL